MSFTKKSRLLSFWSLVAVSVFVTQVSAYDGSETWLHYTAAATDMKASYASVCQSIVMSDANSDTLKNAKAELDLAIPKLLGGSALPTATAVAAGAIVLAPEGSPLVTAAGIDLSGINSEGFVIKSSGGATFISGKTEVGVLRGVFHFLRLMQMGKDISNLAVAESPYFAYRVLDHWWNHYGSNPSVERVYGGGRVYTMERFGDLANGGGSEREKIITYCRMAASLGLNGITPDGVNTTTMNSRNWECLKDGNLRNLKHFADILSTYGLKTFLAISYTSPQRIGGLSTSDPANQGVKDFWVKKVDQIFELIPNFGGFLIKADSENEFGPSSAYGKNQSAGAKPIADALGKHGASLIWRTFIYSSNNNLDFAVTQMETFHNQTWHPNIILRMKDGPRDFQTVEPPNFIATYGGMRHGMEFQVTQEYTGQDKHVCWLVPKWKQVYDWNMKGAQTREGVEGTLMRQILRGDNTWEHGGGVWGISNINSAKNWTGHYLHQANAYGYGRLAWNPTLTENQIAEEWISCSFEKGSSPAVQYLVKDILKKSWKTYEDYTISYSALMPAVCWNQHYEIEFNRDVAGFRTKFFMNLRNDGIGVDRSPSASTFSKFIPSELVDSLCNIESCPEDYLLFFHFCKWDHTMKSGMTLMQSLQHNHFRGIRQVKRFINNWKMLEPIIDKEIYSHVMDKLNTQLADASRWANTFRSQVGSRSSESKGCDLEIVVPNDDEAVTVDAGGSVALSSKFADQNGKAVTETINWSVYRINPGGTTEEAGTLSATEGASVDFSSDCDGIYIVTASTATIPDLKDQLQIFVGDWQNGCPTTAGKPVVNKRIKNEMRLSRNINGVAFTVPFTGTLQIVGLNGRVVKSMTIPKAGVYQWGTNTVGRGLYIVQLKSTTENIRKKLLLR